MPGVDNEGPKYEGQMTCPAAMEGRIVARGIYNQGPGKEEKDFQRADDTPLQYSILCILSLSCTIFAKEWLFEPGTPWHLPLTLGDICLSVPTSIQTPPHGERGTNAKQNTKPVETSASNSNVDQLAQDFP